MGVVFRAEDPQLKRPVALKVMKPSLAAFPDFHRRFLREAQLAAALDHEHVVTVYQVGEDGGVPYLTMKLLEGETLEDRLNRSGGRLPLPEVLRVGREVAEGLDAAHARGLVHRDVKPANVWLEAGRDRVKILDFGLARGTGEDAQFTQMGAVIGTPAYMAPEQANGEEVDGRCDLFGLGAVLYRACTGELPFGGKDTLSVLRALATTTPPPPHQLNPSLPWAFSDLVMRLLAKDRADRPQSAREVVEALAAIERGDVAEPPPDVLEELPPDPAPEAAKVRDRGPAGSGATRARGAKVSQPRPSGSGAAPRSTPLPDGRGSETPKKKGPTKDRPPRRKKRPEAERDWGRRVLLAALLLLVVSLVVLALGVIRYATRGHRAAGNEPPSTAIVAPAGYARLTGPWSSQWSPWGWWRRPS
jgi:serine/threonine protein kinase